MNKTKIKGKNGQKQIKKGFRACKICKISEIMV